MVARMGRFEHGGDVYTAAGTRSDILDFSANLNPLGMPKEVVHALRDAAGTFDAYPDPHCRALTHVLAKNLGISAGQIICTAGASDLIQRLCLAFRPQTALVTAPCFSGYEQALEQVGTYIVRHRLREEEGFEVTERILAEDPFVPAAQPGHNRTIVFLCSPNNPTGLTLRRALLLQLLQAARDVGALVVLDECFLDFMDEPSAVDLVAEFPNLVVMRAFTKTYAMAGLRLGYGACSDAALLRALKAVGQPWAVSTPAQVAGIAALGVEGWIERTRAFVNAERVTLAQGLCELGMQVVPGQANFLLFRSPVALYEPLLERGFLVRRCGNYEGLDDSWYRVAVRTAEENASLLRVLATIRGLSPNGNRPKKEGPA